MNLTISSAQKEVPLSIAGIRRFASWLSKNIPEFHADDWADISMVVMDDAGIGEINARFLNHHGPTDVITFTLLPPPGTKGWRGEIYLNIERAIAEAGRRRIAPSRELAFYIAHGFDHLCGFDDHTPALRARMHARERAWLRSAARLVLLDLLR